MAVDATAAVPRFDREQGVAMSDAASVRLYLLLDQDDRLYRRVLAAFGSAEEALARPSRVWRSSPGLRLDDKYLLRHADWPRGELAADLHRQWQQTMAWLDEPGHGLWLDGPDCSERQWPMGLSRHAGRPPLLFHSGREAALGLPQIAVVGSRAATRHGLDLAHAISADLARAGFAVTSGLASGIDGAAHEGALAAGGTTLAVMGCGLDRSYPPRHQALAGRIEAAGGLLVSEFAPGTPPHGWHFPRRNRVISALSLGVLVVEAGPDSGSIITARAADEMSRLVWAVPGSVHSLQSRGCHELIRQGHARLAEQATDVISDILPTLRDWHGAGLADARRATAVLPMARPEPGPVARQLCDRLDWQVFSFDELVAAGDLPPGTVMAALGELEVLGWVAAVPGGYQRLPL